MSQVGSHIHCCPPLSHSPSTTSKQTRLASPLTPPVLPNAHSPKLKFENKYLQLDHSREQQPWRRLALLPRSRARSAAKAMLDAATNARALVTAPRLVRGSIGRPTDFFAPSSPLSILRLDPPRSTCAQSSSHPTRQNQESYGSIAHGNMADINQVKSRLSSEIACRGSRPSPTIRFWERNCRIKFRSAFAMTSSLMAQIPIRASQP